MHRKHAMDECGPADAPETGLARIGRLDIADVPDMGYEPWNKATRERNETAGLRNNMLFHSPVFAAIGATLVYMVMHVPGPIPIVIHLCLWTMVALCALPTFLLGYTQRLLGKMPDPAGLLPPGSSPELATREHELVTRIEAHNRNIRLLRDMPVIDPEALEKAENEERELRGGTLALTEAKSDIAGLLTD